VPCQNWRPLPKRGGRRDAKRIQVRSDTVKRKKRKAIPAADEKLSQLKITVWGGRDEAATALGGGSFLTLIRCLNRRGRM